MRIPLDYYRILGIFPQVTDEQLSQAYRDRSVQLPRQEFSDAAIASRKQLLNQAYAILSDLEKRSAYEEQFLKENVFCESGDDQESPLSRTESQRTSSWEPKTPEIDLTPEQLIGSLLILGELGEYELIIKFGELSLHSFFSTPLTFDLKDSSPNPRTDIILSIALAYLELSREQWHQEKYEKAAITGIQGLTLLKQNSLFPSVQSEICAELDKLRPYRILELLARPEENEAERHTGKQLLQAMLQERQGIEGRGNDRSGLNIDDFLRFIQQIRTYLSTKEQQTIFLANFQRTSAVAAYLGVYALIARGFAEKTPALIVEAQSILGNLGKRQDVSLEQAVCALLLGQTETAIQTLARCQDAQALRIIQEHSRNSPDLLPGLCIYVEYWLKTEVFSHFRDLINKTASLKGYFADEEVQTYLEQLLLDTQEVDLETQPEREVIMAQTAENSRVLQEKRARRRSSSAHPSYQEPQLLVSGGGGRVVALPTSPFDHRSTPRRKPRNYRQETWRQDPVRVATSYPQHKSFEPKETPTSSVIHPPIRPRKSSQRKSKITPKTGLVAIALLGALGLVGFSIQWIQRANSPLSALEKGQYPVYLNRPLIDIPPAEAQMVTTAGTLTKEGAKKVIVGWLSGKSQAFGIKHEIEVLDGILAKSLLPLWRDRAQQLEQNQNYWTYRHEVKIDTLKTSPDNPNQAIADANVREVAQLYQKGQLSQDRSYDDKLRVRYELVRQGDRWLIQDIKVIK